MNPTTTAASVACLLLMIAQPASAEDSTTAQEPPSNPDTEPTPDGTQEDGEGRAAPSTINLWQTALPTTESTPGYLLPRPSCDADILTTGDDGLLLEGDAFTGYYVGYFVRSGSTAGTVGVGAFVDAYCIVIWLIDEVTQIVGPIIDP